MADKIRDRNLCMILYPEDETHAKALDAIMNNGYRYCAIFHDQDIVDCDDTECIDENGEPMGNAHIGELKKPHYHVYVNFSNARWNTSLASELGIKENYVQKCGNAEAYIRYFSHMDFPAKHQYGVDTIFGNMPELVEKAYRKAVIPEEQALSIFALLDSCGRISFMSFIRLCAENGLYSEARRMGSWLPRMVDDHNSYNALNDEYQRQAKADNEQFMRHQKQFVGGG